MIPYLKKVIAPVLVHIGLIIAFILHDIPIGAFVACMLLAFIWMELILIRRKIK